MNTRCFAWSLLWISACGPKATRTMSEDVPPRSASAAAASQAPARKGPIVARVDTASVQVKNPLAEPRPQETVAIGVTELRKFWLEPSTTVVVDAAGAQVLSQLVDRDGDTSPDELVFQTDLAPNEAKRF